jgi:hypothetical protein
VAILVIVVEAIAYDEGIRDDKPTVIGLDRHDLTTDLAKKDGCANRGGTSVLEVLGEGTQGLPRVEDIVEKQDIAAGNVGDEGFVDHQGRGSCRCAPVAAGLHQSDPQGNSNLADEIGQGDETSRQHGDDCEGLIPVVVLDLAAHRSQAIP